MSSARVMAGRASGSLAGSCPQGPCHGSSAGLGAGEHPGLQSQGFSEHARCVRSCAGYRGAAETNRGPAVRLCRGTDIYTHAHTHTHVHTHTHTHAMTSCGTFQEKNWVLCKRIKRDKDKSTKALPITPGTGTMSTSVLLMTRKICKQPSRPVV